MWFRNFHSGYILGFAALLAPIAGVFAPLLIAPITVVTILGLLTQHILRRGGARSDRPLFAIVGGLLVWAVLSLLWTIDHEHAIANSALLVAFGLLAIAALTFTPSLVEHERHTLRRFVLAGVALGFALFFLEMATSGTISQDVLGKVPFKDQTLTMFNRTASVLFLFIWPALAILWRSWPLVAAGMIALGFVAAYILPNASAAIAYAVGVAFFFIALQAPRGASLFLAITTAFVIVTAPFLPRIAPALDPATVRAEASSNNASFLHRLDIWDFTIDKIEERPLFGWGFDASRVIPGGNERYVVRNRTGAALGRGERLPLHPHNGALQAWLELGLPGAIGFAALFALASLRALRQADRAGVAAALAAIATAAPIWFLSYGIWQNWWLGVLILMAMLTTALAPAHRV